jgi:ubiquinone/menaquinone biosynthesis C-methylase UbiE
MKLDSDPEVRRRFHAWVDEFSRVEFVERPSDPTPWGYYGARLGPAGPEREQALDKYIRYYLDVFEVANRRPNDLDVLEVGSGFGLGLVVLAALGVGRASGVEIVPWQVEYATRACKTLPEDVRERVQPIVGDASALPYEDETFDVVLSLEAISHYLDYQPFLDESYRVLRHGGVLVVSDGNNGLNPRIRRKTHRQWAMNESDPQVDHVDNPDSPWLLVPKRERIIADADPTLEPEVVHDLALRTAGMVRPQIEDAVRRHADTGELPDSRWHPGTLTVHPDQEMVLERLFNPFALGREVAARGFDVRVRGHWGGASGSRLLRVADSVLRSASRLTIPTARGFRIRAVKP